MNELLAGSNGQASPVGTPAEAAASPGQATVFGEDAASYERFRPGYPRELLEQILGEAPQPAPVLEIGAGTGKATRALQALGRTVHAIEPDGRMAAVLRSLCQPDQLHVEATTLEAAVLPARSYALALAAQSWHWVDRRLAYDLVADALTPDGVLALVWHHPQPDQGLFGVALGQLYQTLAPSVRHPLPGHKANDFDPDTEPVGATERFDDWVRLEHRWRRRLDAPALVGWLCSQSDHRLLPVAERAELMAGVTALVSEFGGEVVISMATVAHLGRRV